MNQNSHTLSSATDDEAAIRSLYQQLMDGWNAASGYAFAAPFEEDGDLVGFDGTHQGASRNCLISSTLI